MYSVLFVCTANVCRSPMAMGLLKAKVKSEKDTWRIESAGVWAMPGYPAAENTQLILSEIGVDLSGHASRPVSRELLAEFKLILTMESGHKEALKAAFPQFASRVYMLSEMIGKVDDLGDPIGRPLVDFRATAREIHQVLTQGFGRIRALARDNSNEDVGQAR